MKKKKTVKIEKSDKMKIQSKEYLEYIKSQIDLFKELDKQDIKTFIHTKEEIIEKENEEDNENLKKLKKEIKESTSIKESTLEDLYPQIKIEYYEYCKCKFLLLIKQLKESWNLYRFQNIRNNQE
jgi:glutamyl/glutaminyl-tRNA synthetase